MPELETVDLEGVEILAAGGPVHAIGAPPEGDYWTPEQLRAMVAAAHELGDEVRAPARIGHRRIGESQEAALRASPAVGWLTNYRLSEGGQKLLADVKRVPRRFGEVIRAGGYRTRSAELSKITSQRTGKTYDWVVTGLAWLGDRLPAVQTLDDVVALYEGEAERRLVCSYEDAASSGEALEAILRALAIQTTSKPWDGSASRFSDDEWRRSCLLDRGGSFQTAKTRYGLPVREPDGTVNLNALSAAASVLGGGRGGVQASPEAKAEAKRRLGSIMEQVGMGERRAEDDPGSRKPPADTRAMSFSDEQRKAFAEATGLEAEKVTDEMLAKAGVAEETPEPAVSDEQARELSKALGVEPKGDEIDVQKLLEAAKAKGETGDGDGEGAEAVKALERRLEAAEKQARDTAEELRLERRQAFVEDALKAGKIVPGARAKLERAYDRDPQGTVELVAEIAPNEELVREFGSAEPTPAEKTEQDELEKAFEADLASRLGVKAEELI